MGKVKSERVRFGKQKVLKKYRGVRDPPKNTHFKYPNGEEIKGKVVDEVHLENSGKGGDYLFVIQKIEYEDVPEPDAENPWIRFGYYRKEHDEDKYRWGSQTTFHVDKRRVEEIVKKAVDKGFLEL